jgi:hypothetical protein
MPGWGRNPTSMGMTLLQSCLWGKFAFIHVSVIFGDNIFYVFDR